MLHLLQIAIMDKINLKLQKILDVTGLDIKTFSKVLKCDYVKMKRMLEAKDDITFDFINNILNTFNEINPTWLMLDKGEVLLKPFSKKKYLKFTNPIQKTDENQLHNDIANRLIQIRNILGQNQTEFAHNLEVRRQKIVAVESLRNSPSIYLIYNLVRKYQVRFSFLFFGEGSPFSVTGNNNLSLNEELLSLIKKLKITQ